MTIENTIPYTPPVLDLLSSNLKKHGNPLGLSNKDLGIWTKGLQLPDKCQTILYTGGEYQMSAYLPSMMKVLKNVKFGDTLFTAFKGIQSMADRIGVDLVKTYGSLAGSDNQAYNAILRMAALTLRDLKVEFTCIEGELYSGALLYEYGLFERFAEHAQRVAEQLHQAGATRIIALSPHSAEIFKNVYPRFVKEFNFEVTPYVMVIDEALKQSGRELALRRPASVTYHDPCHLARTLKITEEPRRILKTIKNLELKEVTPNRAMTNCCGAPCEVIYPELAEQATTRRLQELSATGAGTAITLCPFCLANLQRGTKSAGIELKITDFIEIVYSAMGGNNA